MADKNDVWKAHTKTTVKRIRQIFAQQGVLSHDKQIVSRPGQRNNLYRMALDITLTELKPNEPFPWGKFTNVLRILVCGQIEEFDENDLFEGE